MLETSISRTKAGAGTVVLPLAARSLAKATLRQLSRLCLCLLVLPGLASLALHIACLVCLPSGALLVLGRVLIQEIMMTLARKVPLAGTRRTARHSVLRMDLACLLCALTNS